MSTVVWEIRYRGTQLGPVCAGFCAENAQASQTCESLRRKRACAIFQHRDAMAAPTYLTAPLTAPGALPLINRMVLAPLTRGRAGASRVANATIAEYYRQRAGFGLIVTEVRAAECADHCRLPLVCMGWGSCLCALVLVAVDPCGVQQAPLLGA